MEYKDREKQFKEDRKSILEKKLELDHAKNKMILEGIKDANPKYAGHITKQNELVMNFAMRAAGGIEILDQPVCRRCEGVALWDHKTSKKEDRAYCMSCHVHTVNPTTVKEYLLNHVKGFSEMELNMLLEAQQKLEKGNDENDRIIIE